MEVTYNINKTMLGLGLGLVLGLDLDIILLNSPVMSKYYIWVGYMHIYVIYDMGLESLYTTVMPPVAICRLSSVG